MENLPRVQTVLKQHLVVGAYLLQIFQFASHDYNVKREIDRKLVNDIKKNHEKDQKDNNGNNKNLESCPRIVRIKPLYNACAPNCTIRINIIRI